MGWRRSLCIYSADRPLGKISWRARGPAYHSAPTNEAIKAASEGNEKKLDAEQRSGQIVERKLNVRNTFIKFALDQTFGSVVNTFLFANMINYVKAGMVRPDHLADRRISARLVMSKDAYDFRSVDTNAVLAKVTRDFWPIITAGWRFWPFVSLISFTFLKTVMARNLLGSIAGLAWGIYMSLVTA